jgi:acyl phosphate:glycerol-3-phosphate acyltransferase
MIDLLVALGLGYLLGSLPSAQLAARLRGASIFEVGSGNMGAMNTARNLGFGLGVAVLAADVGKGAAAAGIGWGMAALAGGGPFAGLVLALAAGVGAVLGHAWSAFVGFRGGKALATAFGAALPAYPITGLAMAVLLIALTLLLRPRHTLAAALAVLLYPVVAFAVEMRVAPTIDHVFAVLTAVLVIAAIILVKHLPARRGAGTQGADT